MNVVGSCLEVVSAVPSVQELARREYCMGTSLSGEYSRLCLHFVRQCVHWANNAFMALSDEVDTEVAHERFHLVVKVARWFEHNMLFKCGAILSAPNVDRRLTGMHVEVRWEEFVQVRRGAYVVLEAMLPIHTAMYAWGVGATRSGERWVVPGTMGGGV